jgi:hypothetical protein
MTDTPPPLPVDPAAFQSANAQTIVASVIVCGLVIIALGALIIAWADKGAANAALTTVGVIAGGLIAGLNTPSGIANVLAQAKKSPQQ